MERNGSAADGPEQAATTANAADHADSADTADCGHTTDYGRDGHEADRDSTGATGMAGQLPVRRRDLALHGAAGMKKERRGGRVRESARKKRRGREKRQEERRRGRRE